MKLPVKKVNFIIKFASTVDNGMIQQVQAACTAGMEI